MKKKKKRKLVPKDIINKVKGFFNKYSLGVAAFCLFGSIIMFVDTDTNNHIAAAVVYLILCGVFVLNHIRVQRNKNTIRFDSYDDEK